MKFALGLAAGISLTWTFFYYMDAWTYSRALASFTCMIDDRHNVYTGGGQAFCVDMSNSYPAEWAMDRLLSNLQSGLDRAAP